MRKYQVHGILLFFVVILLAMVLKAYVPKEQKSAYIQRIEEQERGRDLVYYGHLKRILAAGAPAFVMTVLLLVAVGVTWAHLKRARVHVYKIGKSEIVVHERDLGLAHHVAMGLINAEQLKQYNAGMDKAFQLSMQIADIQQHHLKALAYHRTPMLPGTSEAHPDRDEPARTPTFQELLAHGDIQPGKPMILGFEHGVARRGSFLDIYSAAVAGESGSGKTGTLLYLIASGLIAEGVRFHGIDPHYPHPKSLGYKTKPLWEHGFMQIATNMIAMQDMLHEIETTIDNRLQQLDTDTTPVVLVIDELAFLNKTSLGKPLAHTMERISTEGRKCAVYMLASSQTWLVARTGDSSAVRDTLTSAYVHRIKPRQANLLLQSKDASQTVEKYVKKPGECLLVPVCDDPVLCTMPLTTEHDMLHVANMLEPIWVNGQVNGQVNEAPVNLSVNQRVNLRNMDDRALVNLVNARIKKGDLSELSDLVGVSKPMLSSVLNQKKSVSEKVRTGFIAYLEKVIPFPEQEK